MTVLAKKLPAIPSKSIEKCWIKGTGFDLIQLN
jgi:hypothetical protein